MFTGSTPAPMAAPRLPSRSFPRALWEAGPDPEDRTLWFPQSWTDAEWTPRHPNEPVASRDKLSMEYLGYVEPDGYDRVVFRGDVKANEFIAFWLKDGRVLAGMNMNIWDVTDPIRGRTALAE